MIKALDHLLVVDSNQSKTEAHIIGNRNYEVIKTPMMIIYSCGIRTGKKIL